MTTLKGKTLFITGASRGIGRAIALRAARDGANVAIVAKSGVPNPKLPGTIHTVAAEVEQAGGRALPIQCDIREEDQVREAVAATVASSPARITAGACPSSTNRPARNAINNGTSENAAVNTPMVTASPPKSSTR